MRRRAVRQGLKRSDFLPAATAPNPFRVAGGHVERLHSATFDTLILASRKGMARLSRSRGGT
jgi:hypothetical protein